MTPFWERDPDRLADELEAFARQGLQPSDVVEDGKLVVSATIRAAGATRRVEVWFPPLYPDIEPKLRLLGEQLPRHHEPGGEVCLLADHGGADWDDADLAADVLVPRFRQLLRDIAAGPDTLMEREVDWPEPVSGFYAYADGSVLIPDPAWDLDLGGGRGTAQLVPCGTMTRVAVLVRKRSGNASLAVVDGETWSNLTSSGLGPLDMSDTQGQNVAWYAVEQPLPRHGVGCSLDELIEQSSAMAFTRRRPRGGLALLTFLEEGPERGRQRRTWLLAKVEDGMAGKRTITSLQPGQRLSTVAHQQRIPHLTALADAHVTVIGAGSLGSQVVLELAKTGIGKINVVDHDTYDANNSVRHVLAKRDAGRPKVDALAEMARSLNPHISVNPLNDKLGRYGTESPEVLRAVRDANVVVDTTGADNVARALSSLRAATGDVITASVSYGARGAEILVVPADGPCFECFKRHQEGDDPAIPTPLEIPRGPSRTPAGCAHPTVPGAGFEITSVAADVVRTTTRLIGGTDYPPLDWNWMITDMWEVRDERGTVERHPECWRHEAPGHA